MQYCHGCRQGCFPLPNYVGNKTQEEVEFNSQQRDNALLEWCDQVNTAIRCPDYATYVVKTDCHDYSVKMLKHYFYAKPHLAHLIQDYMTKTTITIEDILDCNQNLTYIAVLQGSADKTLNLKPLFSKKEEGDWIRQDETTDNIIVTKDYLDYLRREFNFQISSVASVFFYKKCNTFNQIFQNLVTHRADPNISLCQKQLLKKIINYSTGFFGFNQNKPGQCNRKIVSKFSKYYDITRHSALFLGKLENKDYYIKTCYKRPSACQKKCLSPLPIYSSIVEYGKMKMAQILTFFDFFLIPESYCHLYSNTDNVILALSTKTIEDAVKPHLKDWFQIEKSLIFSNNEPGHLKQEFYFSKESEWKFVSPIMQNYSILTKDSTGLHKSSAFYHISTLESYNYSLLLLDKKCINVTQPRRTNKIVSTEIYEQNFVVKIKE